MMRSLSITAAITSLVSLASAQETIQTLTPFLANNGGGAGWTQYFDITLTQAHVLTSISINSNTAAGTIGDVEVFITDGTTTTSHIGNEDNPVWTSLGVSSQELSAATDSPTRVCFTTPIVINPGSFGFAVQYNGFAPAYTNGTGAAPAGNQGPYVSTPAGTVSITAGSSTVDGPGIVGGGLFTPRVWNGILEFDGTCTPNVFFVAEATEFGAGCGQSGVGPIYEQFDGTATTFDFAAGTGWQLLLTGAEYTAIPGFNAIVAPTGANPLTFGDDEVQQITLPFALPTRTGSTTDVWVSSNGFLSLNSTTDSDFSESVAELLNDADERVCAVWNDLNPSAGGTIDAEADANGVFHITFTDVPEFAATTPNTFQYSIDSTGTIEVKYGVVSSLDSIVGYSAGNGVADTGAVDMNDANLAVTTTPTTSSDMTLTSDRPLATGIVNFMTNNLPAGGFPGAVILGTTRFPMPVPLDILGATGCVLTSGGGLGTLNFVGAGPTQAHSLDLTGAPLGIDVFLQTASLAIGVNPFGVITSNGIQWTIGDV